MARPQHAMRADELQHLERAFVVAASRGDIHVRDASAALLRALGKRLDDGRMCDILRCVARRVGQAIKLLPPIFRHGSWVGQILFVKLLHVRCVGTEEETGFLEFSHHGVTSDCCNNVIDSVTSRYPRSC